MLSHWLERVQYYRYIVLISHWLSLYSTGFVCPPDRDIYILGIVCLWKSVVVVAITI